MVRRNVRFLGAGRPTLERAVDFLEGELGLQAEVHTPPPSLPAPSKDLDLAPPPPAPAPALALAPAEARPRGGPGPQEIRRLAVANPTVLSASVDRTLRPKSNFLATTMGRAPRELLKCPSYFNLGLETRIVPRYTYAVERGRDDLSLGTLLIPGDVEFAVNVMRGTVADYMTFKLRFCLPEAGEAGGKVPAPVAPGDEGFVS
eukprot:tig00000254_g22503.t1